MVTTVERGNWGERLAASYLQDEGWELIERNWRCPLGEIDIVAREGDVLVFVEVKTRTSAAFGWPVESVTASKLARLRRLAAHYISGHASARDIRIDVIGIMAPAGHAPSFTHYRGVS